MSLLKLIPEIFKRGAVAAMLMSVGAAVALIAIACGETETVIVKETVIVEKEVEVEKFVEVEKVVVQTVVVEKEVEVIVEKEVVVEVELVKEVLVVATATPIPTAASSLTPGPTETPAPTATPSPTPELPSKPAELVERAQQSVVRVKARSGGAIFGQTRVGSGFIFAVEGTTAFVATNHHVIDGSSSVEVQIGDSSTYDALILGWDAERDVAVLSICCSTEFVALSWASASLSEGETVIAIGYPDNDTGNVIATIGQVRAPDDLSMEHGFIPHSAPLNPGNSGGPLFSMPGTDVVGINTARGTETLAFYAVPYQAIEDQVEEWRAQLIVAPTPTPTLTPSAKPAFAIPFATIEGEDFAYTLHEIRDPVEPRSEVTAGHRLVGMDVTLEALRDDVTFHPREFALQDIDGYWYTPDWTSHIDPELSYFYPNLSAKQKIRGWITIEVPESAILMQLLITELMSDRTVIIAELRKD